jgi:hypothetical protein
MSRKGPLRRFAPPYTGGTYSDSREAMKAVFSHSIGRSTLQQSILSRDVCVQTHVHLYCAAVYCVVCPVSISTSALCFCIVCPIPTNQSSWLFNPNMAPYSRTVGMSIIVVRL